MARQYRTIDNRPEIIALKQRQCRRTHHLLRRPDGGDQSFERDGLELIKLVARESQFFQHRLGQLAGALPPDKPDGRTTHDDRAVEQAARRWHRQQRAHLAAAAGLAKDRHTARIAAEPFDVVAHPLQSRQHIERAGIARVGELGTTDLGQMQMPEDIEPLIDAHDDDIVALGQIGSVEPGHVRGAVGKGAAVVPDHNGTFGPVAQTARPDVQGQAVLAFRNAVARAGEARQFRALLEARRRLRCMPGPR